MKILSIGNFGHGWDGSICDEEHIAQGLESSGHEVVRVQREHLSSIHGLRAADDCDFTLIAQWDGYPDHIGDVPKPLVYWAFDYQAGGQEWHEKLVAEADLYLSKRIADYKYNNWQWLSQDFAPPFLRPVDKPKEVEKDIDILFTGTWLPWADERNDTLLTVQKYAVENKLNFAIHSVNMQDWPQVFMNVNGPVMDDALPGLIARTKVNLSIDHTIEAGYWSDRNFQILACGGRVVSRYVPLAENTFIDKEGDTMVRFFHDSPSCLKAIRIEMNASPVEGWECDIPWSHVMTARHSLKRRVIELIKIVENVL